MMTSSELIKEHPGRPQDWYRMIEEPFVVPDRDTIVKKITRLMDRAALTFEYHTASLPEGLLLDGLLAGVLPHEGDFYTGTQPTIGKLIAIPGGRAHGSRLIIEWQVHFPSAVYRAATRTLYVCAISPEHEDASQR